MAADGSVVATLVDSDESQDIDIMAIGENGAFINISGSSVQHYSASGVLENTTDLNNAYVQAMTTLDDSGSYILVLDGYDSETGSTLSASTYNSNGELQNTSAIISTSLYSANDVQVASLGNGQAAITWSINNTDSSTDVYVQTINADGSLQGDAILVSELFVGGSQQYTSINDIVSVGDQGNYLVTGRYYEDNIGYTYFVASVAADGMTTTIYAGTSNEGEADYSLATLGDDGGFAITTAENTYDSEGSYISNSINVQLYNADGSMNGDVISLGATEYSYDSYPAVVGLNENGEFIVTWVGQTYADEVNYEDVYVQKFNADGTPIDKTVIDTNGDVSVSSSSDGVAYLVNSNLFSDDFLTDYDQWEDGLFETTLNANDSLWNSVEVTGGEETSISAAGLEVGDYIVLMTDTAGNVSVSDVNITVNEPPVDVVFNLTTGESSDFGSQTFLADESYDIFINIGDGSNLSLNVDAQWSGAENLGDDDTIILVSDNAVTNYSADEELEILWSLADNDATLSDEGDFSIADDNVDLWEGNWSSNPDADLVMSQVVATDSPDV
jgi:hypothetical protein